MQEVLLTFVCVVLWCVGGDGDLIVYGAPFNLGVGHWWCEVVVVM